MERLPTGVIVDIPCEWVGSLRSASNFWMTGVALGNGSIVPTTMDQLDPQLGRIVNNLETTIIGKRSLMEFMVTAVLAQGHVLIDDVPGVGKTTVATTLARSLGLTHRRIQCTPDLLPTDITGVTIFHPGTRQFEFHPGPVFANLVIADEINRTSPRTQSALLEVMEEGQVTVDGVTHPLQPPFLVVATQNPIEYDGTFPLPESQLDRFLFRLNVGYPSVEEESNILSQSDETRSPESVQAVITLPELLERMQAVKRVHVSDTIRDYIARIAETTRSSPRIELGMSPRASLALYRAAQAWALLHSRAYVVPDDVLTLAPFVVEHRLILSRTSGTPTVHLVDDVFKGLLQTVPIPPLVQ
ncbi:MoxR family ATPase [Ferrimicrobium sp.]|nr:MoxR family ATPase [Ferrimicrobium sp.]